jgi:hypothetical protein
VLHSPRRRINIFLGFAEVISTVPRSLRLAVFQIRVTAVAALRAAPSLTLSLTTIAGRLAPILFRAE